MPLELVLTCPGQNFPASEEKSPVLLGWISSNGTRPEPRSNSASAGAKPGGIKAPITIPSSPGFKGRNSFRSRSVSCHCEAKPWSR